MIVMPHSNQNLIAIAHGVMAAKLAGVTPPRLLVSPDPEDFEAVAEYVHAVARIMDEWMLRVGNEVQSNSTVKIDMGCFTGTFTDAVEGWALAEINREAEALREDRAA